MQKTDPRQITDNVIELIGRQWTLITAGVPEKFNTMTASWGGIGFLWNKPVAFVFVRPERYTDEFMIRCAEFTLSFPGPAYRKALNICGSTSGRDTDKIAASGLTPHTTSRGNVTFEESRLTLECRKLYTDTFREGGFIDRSILDQWYTTHGNLHNIYIAEIIEAWIAPDVANNML
ncbi:MAG: flavin reductase family protein [Rikenellaceae bacterium]|nr:flavin reductase family protein [Rikenellaceae bacterium]